MAWRGVQTTGSFSLNEVFNTIGVSVLSAKTNYLTFGGCSFIA
jgi:hypothetical protein